MALLIPRITGLVWSGPQQLRATFATPLIGFFHQLYVGRRLVAETAAEETRSLTFQLEEFDIPEELAVVAIEDSERGVDFGATLPPRPYSRVMLSFDTTGWPADTRWVDVYAGTEPEAAIDEDNRLARLNFEAEGPAEVLTPPLRSGLWNFRIQGRDDKPVGGNAGTPVDLQARTLAYPSDLAGDPSFAVTASAGELSLSWSY
jgi:hypothetical protein